MNLRHLAGLAWLSLLLPPGLATAEEHVTRSDNAPFLWQDYPALMFSDTSEARDPHYHLPSDVPENLDYEDMARMAQGFVEAIERLADASTALSS